MLPSGLMTPTQVCLWGLCLCSEEGSVTPTAVRLKLEEPQYFLSFPPCGARGREGETPRGSGEILTLGVMPVLSLFALHLFWNLAVCMLGADPRRLHLQAPLVWSPVRRIGGSLAGGGRIYLSSALSALVASLAGPPAPLHGSNSSRFVVQFCQNLAPGLQ